MKRITILLLSLTVLFGCGDDVEFNTPAFQGNKDYTLWRADFYSASINENGVLTIRGGIGTEEVKLIIPVVAEGTYTTGDVASMRAEHTDATGTVFSTANNPEPSNDPTDPVYPEYGRIVIETIDTGALTFSGTFRFIAFNATQTNSVGFNDGIFYKVPLVSGTIPTDPTTCEDVTANAEAAQLAYEATLATQFIDSAAYEAACAAYVVALEAQMALCGDISGEIQETIDALGDCTFTCDQATQNTTTAQDLFDNATLGNYITACNDYATYLAEQITRCGDDDGSLQALIDGLNCDDSDNDGVADIREDFNGDDDFTNDDSDGDLNPNYLDDDDDDDGVTTATELAFDADGNPADTDGDLIPDYIDTDDDGDGILTIDEDIDMDGNPANDDTDGDGIPNYLDSDDDGDGILTIFEDLNGDGNPTNDDTDGDMTPNYLDEDDDGDSVFTIYENPDADADGNPMDAQDFDSDGTPDYLDNNDDNDAELTIDENPDPNGDGNPDDAENTDADSNPDYLDADA